METHARTRRDRRHGVSLPRRRPGPGFVLAAPARRCRRHRTGARWPLGHDALFDADPDAPGKLYVREGGFLDDIDRFDAAFFGISPRGDQPRPPATPPARTTWQALDAHGISADSMANSKTGVYVGVMENDYAKLLRDNGADDLDAYYVTGNHFSFTAGRISYVLGLHGPAVALDTACSSSLVAIHLRVSEPARP